MSLPLSIFVGRVLGRLDVEGAEEVECGAECDTDSVAGSSRASGLLQTL